MSSVHRRPSSIVVFLSALWVAGSALAAPAPQFVHAFTLMELTDMALTNNPQTKLAWEAIRSSQAGVELARAGYWPQLSLSYTYTRNDLVSLSGSGTGAETQYGPAVSLSYLLWDFGTRSGGLDAAKFALTSAELSNSQTLQDVILAVEQDYYQVLGLQALERADKLSAQDSVTSLDSVRGNQKSGLATIGDVYQAEAALAGARLAVQQTQGQLAVAQGTLATVVGLPANTHLALANWNQNVKPVMPRQPIESLLEEADHARPELLAAKAGEQEAIANLEVTKARGLPELTVSADAGSTRTLTGPTSQSIRNYSAGLTLSVPLFTGFSDQAATRQAEAQVDISQATATQLRQTVELEVWQAYQNLHTAFVTLSTTALELRSAQQAGQVARARYRIGLDPILSLLTAEATLANARVQQVQARLNWFTALAALGHAVGGLTAHSEEINLP